MFALALLLALLNTHRATMSEAKGETNFGTNDPQRFHDPCSCSTGYCPPLPYLSKICKGSEICRRRSDGSACICPTETVIRRLPDNPVCNRGSDINCNYHEFRSGSFHHMILPNMKKRDLMDIGDKGLNSEVDARFLIHIDDVSISCDQRTKSLLEQFERVGLLEVSHATVCADMWSERQVRLEWDRLEIDRTIHSIKSFTYKWQFFPVSRDSNIKATKLNSFLTRGNFVSRYQQIPNTSYGIIHFCKYVNRALSCYDQIITPHVEGRKRTYVRSPMGEYLFGSGEFGSYSSFLDHYEAKLVGQSDANCMLEQAAYSLLGSTPQPTKIKAAGLSMTALSLALTGTSDSLGKWIDIHNLDRSGSLAYASFAFGLAGVLAAAVAAALDFTAGVKESNREAVSTAFRTVTHGYEARSIGSSGKWNLRGGGSNGYDFQVLNYGTSRETLTIRNKNGLSLQATCQTPNGFVFALRGSLAIPSGLSLLCSVSSAETRLTSSVCDGCANQKWCNKPTEIQPQICESRAETFSVSRYLDTESQLASIQSSIDLLSNKIDEEFSLTLDQILRLR